MPRTTDRIKKQVVIRAPLATVWSAISDSAQFGHWFGIAFDGPFVAGQRVTGRMAPTSIDPAVAKQQEPYEGMLFEADVERIEPMRLLSFRWTPGADPNADRSPQLMTLVEFQLEEIPEGTRLTITESGFDRLPKERRAKVFEENDEGWKIQTRLVDEYVRRLVGAGR